MRCSGKTCNMTMTTVIDWKTAEWWQYQDRSIFLSVLHEKCVWSIFCVFLVIFMDYDSNLQRFYMWKAVKFENWTLSPWSSDKFLDQSFEPDTKGFDLNLCSNHNFYLWTLQIMKNLAVLLIKSLKKCTKPFFSRF